MTGAGGDAGEPPAPMGGTLVGGAAGTSGSGVGGGGGSTEPGGAAGAGMDCGNRREVVLPVTFDTWIDQTQPNKTFSTDSALSVQGAPDEQRIMLNVKLPAASDVLRQAQLELHLEANADALKSARVLGLYRLEQAVGATTSWRNYASGKKWITEGGDLGPELARATLADATSAGVLAFDVTDFVRTNARAEPLTLPVVILEIDAAPASPSQLALTSLEGNVSSAPALLLSYCEP